MIGIKHPMKYMCFSLHFETFQNVTGCFNLSCSTSIKNSCFLKIANENEDSVILPSNFGHGQISSMKLAGFEIKPGQEAILLVLNLKMPLVLVQIGSLLCLKLPLVIS